MAAPNEKGPINRLPLEMKAEGPLADQSIPSSTDTSHIAAALNYLARNFSVIALRAGEKLPAHRWAEFQNRRMTEAEALAWWGNGDESGIGIVTGRISGLVVLDLDGPEAEAAVAGRSIPPTPTVITGRGRHIYFAHSGVELSNRTGLLPHCDLRGDGGYVAAPPSKHPSGVRYRWAPGLSFKDVPLAAPPEWLLKIITAPSAPQETDSVATATWPDRVVAGVGEGERNATAASLIGHLLAHHVRPSVARTLVLAWNAQLNRPSLPIAEVEEIIDSIATKELSRRQGRIGND